MDNSTMARLIANNSDENEIYFPYDPDITTLMGKDYTHNNEYLLSILFLEIEFNKDCEKFTNPSPGWLEGEQSDDWDNLQFRFSRKVEDLKIKYLISTVCAIHQHEIIHFIRKHVV